MVEKKNPPKSAATDEPEVPAQASPDEAREAMVRWVGEAGERRIMAQDWEARGITGPDVVWDQSNGRALPKSQFTEEQLRILSGEPNFQIEE